MGNFKYFVRQIIFGVRNQISNIDLSVACVIQANEDANLPEQVIFALRTNHININDESNLCQLLSDGTIAPLQQDSDEKNSRNKPPVERKLKRKGSIDMSRITTAHASPVIKKKSILNSTRPKQSIFFTYIIPLVMFMIGFIVGLFSKSCNSIQDEIHTEF